MPMFEAKVDYMDVWEVDGTTNVVFNNTIRKAASQETHRNEVLLQASEGINLQALDADFHFEVRIKTGHNRVFVGFTPIEQSKYSRWGNGSSFYQAFDGLRVLNSQWLCSWKVDPECSVIGYGLRTSTGEIFITLNGKFVGVTALANKTKMLYPTIAICNPEEEVSFSINIDAKKMDFDFKFPSPLIPYLGDLNWTFYTGLDVLVVFLYLIDNQNHSTITKELEKAAKIARRKFGCNFIFSRERTNEAAQLANKTHTLHNYPIVFWKQTQPSMSNRFIYDMTVPITTASIISFLSNAQNGLIIPYIRTEPRPIDDRDPNNPAIIKVVASSFRDVVLQSSMPFMLFYKLVQCGHSAVVLAEILKNKIAVGWIDTSKNEVFPEYCSESSRFSFFDSSKHKFSTWTVYTCKILEELGTRGVLQDVQEFKASAIAVKRLMITNSICYSKHPFVKCTRRSYTCNECSRSAPTPDAYHCKDCDYDMCILCAEEAIGQEDLC